MKVALTVNGRPHVVDAEPRTSLADLLREHLLLTGTHVGCEHGVCGACTVVINGETARACITLAASCEGAEVRTIEGFSDDALMARLRQRFKEEHALQCGYCTPGMLIAARDLVRRKGGLTEREIRLAMSGNLCRCTGYVGIVRAVQRVMVERDGLLAGLEPPARHLGPLPPLDGRIGAQVPGRNAAPVRRPDAVRIDDVGSRGPIEPQTPWDDRGATHIEETFRIAAPRAEVWALMADIERLAACLPGAQLDGPPQGDRISGSLAVRLGPITTRFRGTGSVARNDAGWRGTVEGQGRDGGSRARGRIAYRLVEEGAEATRVDVAIAYALAGPLAQFSRGDLVRDVVRQIARAFAANVEAAVSGRTPAAAATEIRAGVVLWRVLWARLRALLGLWR
jgi:carbon-monoxide dehydrogenase small subunit